MHAYDAKDLERLFGLPAAAVRSLTRAGHLNPVRRAGKLNYSFRDLVVLRTASALRAAKIPAQRVNRTLQKLRASMPEGETLERLSLTALGDRIAVREGKLLWESDSGQYVLALDVGAEPGRVYVMSRASAATDPVGATAELAAGGAPPASPVGEEYARALGLEDSDPAAARAAYEACLDADASHVEARINLGRLLHLAGCLDAAEQVYRAAERPDPVLAFNLAVLLEDLNRETDAIHAYRQALALDPKMADAHFNLARLYGRAQDSKASLRHLLVYRRIIDRRST